MADGLGPYGLKLLAQFEPGPDGKPATVAYECGGGRWTLGLGATTWPNGKDIKPGDFCTPEQAIELTNWHVRKYLAVVDEAIDTSKRPLTKNQRDAMTLTAYNIGPEAFKSSSIARRFNDGETAQSVAEAFGMWCKATNDNPDKYDLDEPHYQEIIGRNAKGQHIWVGPAVNPPNGWKVVRDGDEFWGVDPNDIAQRVPLGLKPCSYQRAYPGLSRRHLSGGCLFLDLDWRQACRKETVSITADRIWDSKDRRWEDLVRKKTELPDILPLARRHPLPPLTEPADAVLFDPLPMPPPDAKPAQAAIPDSSSDVLVLDTPAVTGTPVSKAGTPEPATQPAPASPAPKTPAATGSGLAGPAGSTTPPSPTPPVSHPGNAPVPPVVFKKDEPKPVPPVVVAGQDGTKPKSPNTVAPAEVPYRIDPNAGLKPIEESDRVKGYVVQQVGIGVIRLGALGVFGSTIQAGAQTVQGDPVLSNIILMGFVAAGIAVVGYVVKTYGDWKKKRGAEKASQALY